MSEAKYNFFSFLRQGIAAELSASNVTEKKSHVSLPFKLKVNDADANVSITLMGPGDINAIDSRLVMRTEPPNLATDFKPNYFPAIEFASAHFPWLFTPETAGDKEQLRPWICLIAVIKKEENLDLGRKLLPVLTVPRKELPNLEEAWAWAHVQANIPDNKILEDILAGNPERVISRLLCPCKLKPNTTYYACVVPIFKVGVKTGLGEKLTSDDETKLEYAWEFDENATDQVMLPVYFRWEFSTGEAGDFEELVRRIVPQPLPQEVGGLRDIDVIAPSPELELPRANKSGIIGLESALCSPQTQFTPWPDNEGQNFRRELRDILDAPDNLSSDIVAPPIYGQWHVNQHTVPADNKTPHWLRELNLDPRHRSAAGFGTLVVQNQQEQLVASAWNQSKDIRRINQLFINAKLDIELTRRIIDKRLERMALTPLLQITRSLHTRLKLNDNFTLDHRISKSLVPVEAVSEPFRRLSRPRAFVMRQLFPELEMRPFVDLINNNNIIIAQSHMPLHGMVSMDHVSEQLGSGWSEVRYTNMTPLVVEKSWDKWKPAWPLIGEHVGIWTWAYRANWGDPLSISPEWIRPTMLRFREPVKGVPYNIREMQKARRRYDNYDDSGGWGDPEDLEIPEPKPFPVEIDDIGLSILENFHNAAYAHQQYIDATKALADKHKPETKMPLDISKEKVLEQLKPENTLLNLVKERVNISEQIWDKETLDPVKATPRFTQPMSKPLEDISKELILPGLEHIPQNTSALLRINSRFIEAYMVGLNHEMSRELHWREYPVDIEGTYFQRFWGKEEDILAIDEWDPEKYIGDNYKGYLFSIENGELEAALNRGGIPDRLNAAFQTNGIQLSDSATVKIESNDKWMIVDEEKEKAYFIIKDEGKLNIYYKRTAEIVLLIRGGLIQRYPEATIYAVKAVRSEDGRKRVPGDETKTPMFKDTLTSDVAFYGFDLSIEKARGSDDGLGWFFVIAEHPTACRFGLDAVDPSNPSYGKKPTKWDDLSWGHLVENEKELKELTYVKIDCRLKDLKLEEGIWGQNSAHMAYITLQKPMRVLIHASAMLP